MGIMSVAAPNGRSGYSKSRPEPAGAASADDLRVRLLGRWPCRLSWFCWVIAVWLLLVLVWLIWRIWGVSELAYHSYASNEEIEKWTVGGQASEQHAKGLYLYRLHCAPCHGEDGQGLNKQFPPLRGSEWVIASNPVPLIRVMLNGLKGPLVLHGQQYSSVMPAVARFLTDEELVELLLFLRQNSDWGHNASAINREQVVSECKFYRNRVEPWETSELTPLLLVPSPQ